MKVIDYDKYETVVGLEVHAQLQTASKAFSSDSAEYGGDPNTHVSVISLGHPGTLPRLNEAVVDAAIRIGLATNCQIRAYNEFSRKNYFYADLPKGYQITQFNTPICFDGFLDVKSDEVPEKRIGITRIHMEEDAGKSMHDRDIYDSLIDINRCGVALLEIVSEPDIRNAKEAGLYLTEIRKLVRYLDICDGNMEEGSMRCDANISVRIKGAPEFGTKVEVKNMNSIRNVMRAIEMETKRQIEMLEAGETIYSETRSFDAVNGTTFALRSKELANDYRYFPEPDLCPLIVSNEMVEDVRSNMPALPSEMFKHYTEQLGLSDYDANQITENKPFALYFEELIKHTTNYKQAANMMMGAVRNYLNSEAITISDFKITPERLAGLIALVDNGTISHTAATQSVFPEMITDSSEAEAIARRLNIIQEQDQDLLTALAEEVLASMPAKVAEYKAGKKGVLGLFMGELMKKSGGKADPKVASTLLQKILAS